MTINVKIATVADAIAGLTIAGVKMLDTDKIPVNSAMILPCMFPKPNGFLSNLSPVIETYGSAGNEKITLEYDLTYTYCHALIGTNLSFGVYSNFITNVAAIMVVILTNDVISGAVDFRLSGMSDFGIVTDPAGNAYHGCDFTFHVQEFCEVA